MICPIFEVDLVKDKCPVGKCMYKAPGNGKCLYSHWMSLGDISPTDIAETLDLSLDKVERRVKSGIKRIQIACAIDAYLATLDTLRVATVNNSEREEAEPPESMLSIFNLRKRDLPKVLDKVKYDSWRARSNVDITFEEVQQLFEALTSIRRS